MVNRSEVEQLRIGSRRALSATSEESEVRPIVELESGDLPVQWLCCAGSDSMDMPRWSLPTREMVKLSDATR